MSIFTRAAVVFVQLWALLFRNAQGASDKKFAAVDDEKVLNVHLVPHTHDDVGWLKTVEQYFYGRNSTIQHAHVQSILDTVIQELTMNLNRTFTYVEIKFFSMWWELQSDSMKETVQNLVANGQLSFANGGWCMHDEATTHYMGMIDQTTLGHTFLKRELGVVPKVGWQLDPFGHSATQASLLSGSVGFDALYFGRIDYQDLALRQESQECEGLWSSSPNLNETVFWGLTGSYTGNYNGPSGFDFDIHSDDEPLIGINHTHLVERIKDFLTKVKLQSDRTKDNNIMLTMGTDFRYEQASKNFKNLDKLIQSVLQFQSSGEIDIANMFGPRFDSISLFYSNPEYYTKQKHLASVRKQKHNKEEHEPHQRQGTKEHEHLVDLFPRNISPHGNFTSGQSRKRLAQASSRDTSDAGFEVPWSVKNDDFFPYADCPHCYWTGYFTSRPGLKRLERVASSFLHAARQIESMHDSSKPGASQIDAGCDCSPLYELEDAVGVLQHHDGVSGTAKQHVACDYAKRVQSGIDNASRFVAEKLKRLFLLQDESIGDLTFCQLLNETLCDVSGDSQSDLIVVVYNALSSRRSETIGIPVPVGALYSISEMKKGEAGLQGDKSRVTESILRLDGFPSETEHHQKFILYFDTGPINPVGAKIFRVRRVSNIENHVASNTAAGTTRAKLRGLRPAAIGSSQLSLNVGDTISASNGILTVQFDGSTGQMQKIRSEGDGFSLNVTQDWGCYVSFDSTTDETKSDSKQNSGAYIFRPSTPNQKMQVVPYRPGSVNVYKTDAVVEVSVQFEQPWIRQVTRLLSGQRYVEVEYTVGPVPIDDQTGKEIVTRFSTPIRSNAEFYTDSNGREFLGRKRSSRPTWELKEYEPVAGNFYPVNAATYIEDERGSLSVVVDRSQGGASLIDGTIELMVQRRTTVDDSRGVSEPINETDGGITPYPPFGNATRLGEGVIIKGKHRVMVGKGRVGASLARSQMDKAFSEPLVFMASAPSHSPVPFPRTAFSALQSALPENVMLITFSRLHSAPKATFLIRIGHQYAKSEDVELSKPVEVDMRNLLTNYRVVSMVEKTLTGNRDYSEWRRDRLVWTESTDVAHDNERGFVILLNPMEIRTFELKVAELEY